MPWFARRIVVVAILVALAPHGAFGQDTKSGEVQPGATVELRESLMTGPSIWETLRAQYESPTGPVPEPYVSGLGEAPVNITLREAVLTALRNNPGVIAESLTPVAAETGILQAQAQFDPAFGSEVGLSRIVTPQANLLAGANRLTQVEGVWNFSLSKPLRSGGVAGLFWNNNRFNTDSVFYDLAPQYQPDLLASLNQPLLRDFGLYFTNLRIEIAEVTTEASIERYRAAAANFITDVVANYWAVVGLRERLAVLKGSYELAQKTVRENRTRVDVGVLPPVAILESEAESARREEDVIVATNDLALARRRLRQQVYLPSDNPYLPRAVDPIDRPSSDATTIMIEEMLETAMQKRPEIKAARLSIKNSELNSAIAENQLLPRLDLFANAGLNSLAGRPTGRRDPFDPNNPAGQSPFIGDYPDSLNRLFDGDYYSYEAGIRIEVPIANAGAEAEATRTRVEHQQAYDRYRQTISEVSLEVGQAAGDTGSDLERIDTTRVARELSEQNLQNQTKRYEVGMVTTTDLLKFQNDLATAQVAEIQAVIAYNVSRTRLDRAQGTLLEKFNVVIEPRSPTETPWWAKF